MPGVNDPAHTLPSENRVLIPIGIGLALSLFGDATLYAVLPKAEIAAQAGVSLATVGVLLGLNRLVRIITNGPAGMLYDRLPRRRLMVLSMLLGVVSTACYAAGSGTLWMLAGRVLWGLAWSGIWIGSGTMALDISPPAARGRVNGKLQMSFFLAAAISSFAGGLFTDLFGYRNGLWVSTGLGAAGALVWLLFLPETRPLHATSRQARSSLAPFAFPWKPVLAAALPVFVVHFAIAGVMYATTILWLGQFTEGGLVLGSWLIPLATLTGIFMAIRVGVSIASAPLAGILSDRIGRRWQVTMILLLGGALGMALMGAPGFVLALAGALLASLASGGISTLAAALVGDHVDAQRHSRALSVIYTIGDVGGTLGPMFGLGLIPTLGISSVYWICAGLFAITAIFALILAAREQRL